MVVELPISLVGSLTANGDREWYLSVVGRRVYPPGLDCGVFDDRESPLSPEEALQKVAAQWLNNHQARRDDDPVAS